jgi:dTDP-4-dehydrorhamnose 3,5-epimerase
MLSISSPCFGQWVGARLSAANFKQLWVPEGFAHGFLVLTDYAEFIYKATNFYAPQHERRIKWDDPDIAIDWSIRGLNLQLSEKDYNGIPMTKAEHFGMLRCHSRLKINRCSLPDAYGVVARTFTLIPKGKSV